MKRLLLLALPVLALAGCSLAQPTPATYVSDVGATLNAEVSSNQGGEVLYWFRYGTTAGYGEVTPDRTLQFAAGHRAEDPPIRVSEPIAGLEPNTTYHFQVCSSPGVEPGSRGCVDQDRTFTTGPTGAGRSGFAFSSFFEDAIYTMDADGGNVVRLTGPDTPVGDPAWSPDGTRIAFTNLLNSRNYEIYVMNADGSDPTRITDNPAGDRRPSWSPDGSKLAFVSDRDDNDEIYVMDADGGNQTRLTDDARLDRNPRWSPDGSRIAFDSGYRIYLMATDGGNKAPLTADGTFDETPAWSPDGRRIVFTSYRHGESEIYVMDADGSDQIRLTDDTTHDEWPGWSPDGARISFSSSRTGSSEIYVMNPDGTDPTRLTDTTTYSFQPAWSPRP